MSSISSLITEPINIYNDMKYIITESQLKVISELERTWRDFEYEEQYNKLKPVLVPYVINMIESYDDENDIIDLYDSKDNVVMRFNKGTLYCDKDFENTFTEHFPHPLWFVHGKYIMSDVFNHFYPDYEVKNVQSAHII
jgi:hypothetical protein